MNTVSKNKLPVILIFGPTAVGKTDLLFRLFRGKTEIINADSMQVYKGMDVGTAKPSPGLLKALPHHLINIVSPSEQFDVGNFVNHANKLVPEILGRGKVPVISGGTAFYFKHFLYGLPKVPKSDPAIREKWGELCKQEGISSLYRKLKRVDPSSAERIKPEDEYRVQRALEVWDQTGTPLSSFPIPDTLRDDIDPLIIGLDRERGELYKRIDLRVEIMFRQGLLSEFRDLLKQGYDEDSPGLQAIGYREIFLFQRNGCLRLKDIKELIARNTRRYAKRQITFFRKIPEVRWFHPDDEKLPMMFEEFIGTFHCK